MPVPTPSLLAGTSCFDCLIPLGELRDAVELVIWIDLLNGVSPDPTDPQALITQALPYYYLMSGDSIPAAELAVLVSIATGQALDTTPQGLLNASACYRCVIPSGMYRAIMMGLICELVNGTVTDVTPTGLMTAGKCYICYSNVKLMAMWVALMQALVNGTAFDCSPQGLNALAVCVEQCVPIGLMQLVGIVTLITAGSQLIGTVRVTVEGDTRVTAEGDVRIILDD